MFKPGDLVMVVKPTLCCGHVTPMQGFIFTVARTKAKKCEWYCDYCEAVTTTANLAYAQGNDIGVDVERLRLIPPLLETTEREVEHAA